MRTSGAVFVSFVLILLLLTGCRTAPPELRPVSTQELLAAPPVGDARYELPNYPKEALNTNTDQRKQGNTTGPGPMGGAGGMGGPGGFSPGMAGRGY